MARQLVAFVDRAPEESRPESAGAPSKASGFDHWPALLTAQKGGFEHVVLIASARFRWDEILAGPEDRLLPDAIPAEETAPPAPPEAEAPAPTIDAPEMTADPAPAAPAEGTDSPPAPEPEPTADGPPIEAPATDAVPVASQHPPAPGARKSGGLVEKRAPPRTLGELKSRLHHMAQSGRIDRSALEKLGTELARELAIPSVACRVIPAFARDREQVAFIRSVLGLLRPQLPAALEFADGPRSTAGLGLTLAHGITALRPDVPIAELTTDRSRNLGVHPRSLLHAIEIQQLWKDAASGATPVALLEHLRTDPRLQGLAAPYQRFARAMEFGNPAEAARAARTVHERLDSPEHGRDREDWAAAIHPVINAMTEALRHDQPWSRRQLWMAEVSEKRGVHFLTALHLREALISGLLETYGQNAARGWAPAGAEGHDDARIRPREVMAVVLSDPESPRLVPDLGQVWHWVGAPRNKFVMTSPIALDPALLRDGNHALATLVPLTRAILEENRMKAIVEALPYEKAIELAIGQNAVRVAPTRSRRAPRRGTAGEDAAPPPEGEAAAETAPPQPEAPRPPRDLRPREPRFNRERRGPRSPDTRRPGPDRPREVAAHDRRDGPHRGPRSPSDPSMPITSIPVGGVIRVERASHGLGNLGFALKNAGLNPTERGPKEKPPRKDADAPPSQPPAEAAAEASVASAPPPAPVPERPPEPAPEPAPDFDIAGPVTTEPPA